MAEDGRRPRPPEWARRFARWAVGPDEAPVVEGELAEGFRTRVDGVGEGAARWWYRRQVLGFILRAPAARRMRREEGRMGWFEGVSGDVMWALRSLRRRPTFTAVAVGTLALGIGSNSALFTLLSAHFLTPLPYDHPNDLVLVWEAERATGDVMTVSPGNYYAWKESATSLSAVAAFNVDMATLAGDGGDAEEVPASFVTPDFFSVLGVRPELGTGFSPEIVRESSGDLVLLSHALWVGRYGGDPEILGHTIRVDGRPHTVVGVMPPGFRQPERKLNWQGARLWRPLVLDKEHDEFRYRYLRTVARMAPGATLAQVRTEMAGLSDRLTREHPEENGAWTVTVRTLDDYLLGDARPLLLLLLGAGVTILLIVCANVANLTLARGRERQREFAVRAALGSGSRRLVRQVLVEGVVLAGAGAAVGLAGVYAAHSALQTVQERYFSGLVDVAVNGWVVALTSTVALVAGLLFALPLARTASRGALATTLREGDTRGGGGGRGTTRTRDLLIVGQVALATTLLVASALLVRSFDALVSVPPGFDPAGRITFDLYPPRSAYPDQEPLRQYYQEVQRRVAEVPGVSAVSMTSDMPFTDENRWTTFGVAGRPQDENAAPRADYHMILPDYFTVMDIPVVAGRIFEEGWDPTPMDGAPIVVNERMGDILGPGDAVGKGVLLTRNDTTYTLRVVGVVKNVLDDGYAAQPEPIFYAPWGMSPPRGMSVVVQVRGDAPGAMEGVRRAASAVDADIPIAGLRTLDALLAGTVARPRAASRMGSILALLALLVAAAGIYGVLSYAVQARTREIGIRSALGADGRRLMSMVLGHSTRLLAVGLVLGLVGSVAVGRALSGMLFGVRSWDPASLVAAVAVLATVGTLAAWVPARRAVRIDPKEALRAE